MKNTKNTITFQNYSIALKDTVETFTKQLIYSLFDETYKQQHDKEVKSTFLIILDKLSVAHAEEIWNKLQDKLPEIRTKLDLDAQAAESNDPAANSLKEVYLAYPGFYAITVYRLSNQLLKFNIPILPRMMSEYAHTITGTDIHPGAEIGASFHIDHATGVIIGESTIIKDHVKIFQGVTLGGIHVKKKYASTKRHPTIENNVTIYANATILGGDVVIGENSIIGANVCVTKSVPENSVVTVRQENKIIQKDA